MNTQTNADLHRSLSLAGFRALATASGLLQLCRELEAAGVLGTAAIDRIRKAMFDELMEQAARSTSKDKEFAERLNERLQKLFEGSARLEDGNAMAPG